MDCSGKSFLERATYLIQFEINKHGQCGGSKTVEDRVNTFTPYELLELIATTIDEEKK